MAATRSLLWSVWFSGGALGDSERHVTAFREAAAAGGPSAEAGRPVYVAVRLRNVVGNRAEEVWLRSSGRRWPRGGLEVTHPEMRRYFMTL